MMTKQALGWMALVGSLALATGLAAPAAAGWQPARKADAKAVAADSGARDKLIFRTGRIVEGRILEETDTKIRMRVVSAGGLTAETTFDRADILTIERAPAAGAADAKAETKPADPKADTGPVLNNTQRPAGTGPGLNMPDNVKVYIVELKKEFGRDISKTPLAEIMAEVRRLRPDVLVVKVDTDYKFMGEERPDFVPDDAGPSFSQLETVRQLSTMLTDDIRDDASWETKPRLVAWVNKAMGGSAFIPFIAPEIYYTSTAHHGGIGYLELMFGSRGDEVVREKQISLLLGRAEGLAIKGGHNPKIIRAMSRSDYVLSYRMEGGNPVFLERMPEGADEILLTDDGNEQAGRRDTIQEVVRFKGNDVLILDAPTALRLRVSSGTADTVEQLMDLLGIFRNYVILDNRSERTINEWGRAVSDAERNFDRLWREFNQIQVQGNYRERTAARGRQIAILREIKSNLDRYGEAINPRRIRGAPLNWDIQINLMIDRIQQEQRHDGPP